jgi:hypothetical protein
MNRKTILVFCFCAVMFIAQNAVAVDYWCYGNAKKSTTEYLVGWTIKCEEGQYGTYNSGSSGYFEMVYQYYWTPPAGNYYLTADSAGMNRLYSNSFNYSGSSTINLGAIIFTRNQPIE